ncbi:aminoglycoside phosphotransferase family protein [Microbacterium sp. H1-D42]|uniref:aminoglycoside phosphotransferase family protein n=1 Tax=Microbacterium sp. H1-D42 TaxID=2925844 RepID=UPI001F52B64A|nr:aminoglycoside phosphotransferase family protein [Microbacterium sp. H1-D42]UNK69769.1 aminoglycoside phosphotransferase family protein [Microbacterium sp. H1-D42]
MHDDQLVVTTELAGELIAREFPRLAGLPITAVSGAGTVNAIFRVGADVGARFPLQATDAAVLSAEVAALTEFADASPFPAPRPLGLGAGDERYPSAWALQSWLPGDVADPLRAAHSEAFAEDLGELIVALRAVPVGDRIFAGRGRGGSLSDHDGYIAHCLEQSAGLVDVTRVAAVWTALHETPTAGEHVMSHRDLTPANLLVSEGRLVGVLDGGSFGPADRSLDLVCAWHLLDAPRRARLRGIVGASDAEWRRGAAWALQQAMGLVWYYEESNPVMAELGHSTVWRVLSDKDVSG